jgi:dUTP pyrophosphatase
MKYCKMREVKSIVRANEDDAGIDFYVPTFTKEFVGDLMSKPTNSKLQWASATSVRVPPHEQILIPAGIKVIVPKGYALIAMNKSGVATKKRLDVGACVIDTPYRGEVHINLMNTSNEPAEISEGDKIVQFVLNKISTEQPKEISLEEYEKNSNTTRSSGGFGSTGTN